MTILLYYITKLYFILCLQNEKQEEEKDQDTTETSDQTISPTDNSTSSNSTSAAPATGWVCYIKMLAVYQNLPYRMKIYTEFNLATWLRLLKFTELNISEYLFLNLNYICYHWVTPKNIIISGIRIQQIFQQRNSKFQGRFSSCRV